MIGTMLHIYVITRAKLKTEETPSADEGHKSVFKSSREVQLMEIEFCPSAKIVSKRQSVISIVTHSLLHPEGWHVMQTSTTCPDASLRIFPICGDIQYTHQVKQSKHDVFSQDCSLRNTPNDGTKECHQFAHYLTKLITKSVFLVD